MTNRYAIIDLGTNTFHLLIGEKGDSTSLIIKQRKQVPVKLMAEGFRNGDLQPEAYNRGIQAIEDFGEELKANKAGLVKILGTSALRNANNAPAFLNQIENILDCPVSIIDGDQEATYIYKGVREAVNFSKDPSLILDIGGGSVEFIVGSFQNLLWKQSLEIGAARLISLFPHDFPMTEEQQSRIQQYLDEQISPVLPTLHEYNPPLLIGASGFFETFVNLDLKEVRSLNAEAMPLHYELSLERFNHLKQSVLHKTADELYEMPGMEGFRVPMMGASTLLVDYLLQQLPIQTIYYSDFAMKEGALAQYLKGSASEKATAGK